MNNQMQALDRQLAAREEKLAERIVGECESGDEEVSDKIIQSALQELTEVQCARDMIRKGVYGICEVCRKKIPIGRLNAMPMTTTHTTCQKSSGTFNNEEEHSDESRDRFKDPTGYFLETASSVSEIG